MGPARFGAQFQSEPRKPTPTPSDRPLSSPQGSRRNRPLAGDERPGLAVLLRTRERGLKAPPFRIRIGWPFPPQPAAKGRGGRYGVGHRAGAEGEVAAVQGEGGVTRVGVSEGRQYTRPRPSDALVDRHQHQGVDTARA